MMIDLAALGDGLQLTDRGIWESASADEMSYPEDGHSGCFAVEDQSFWFGHRNRCIAAAVSNEPPPGPIFDVGGGNGFVSAGLERAGFEAVVVEPGPAGAKNAVERGLRHVVCATTDSAGFRPRSLPAIGLFDVLEHTPNDVGFLRDMFELLEPGGCLYLTVPAYQVLWSHEDISAGHYRRYTLSRLEAVARQAGFELSFGSYLFSFLPLPIGVFRSLPYRLGRPPREAAEKTEREHAAGSRPGLTGHALKWLLEPEVRAVQSGRSLPFGGSCLLVARRPKGPG